MSSFSPETLHQFFQSAGGLTPDEASRIVAAWHHKKKLNRWDLLITPDRQEYFLYYVLSGVLRIYCVSPEGEEICVGFSYEGSWSGSYPSLILGKPADYYIQALSPCRLIGILWADFEMLGHQHPNIERCRRILTESALIGRLEREIEMLTLTPEERYRRFFARSAHLFQLIPQKYIASYLGMKPETLSRIKQKLQKS